MQYKQPVFSCILPQLCCGAASHHRMANMGPLQTGLPFSQLVVSGQAQWVGRHCSCVFGLIVMHRTRSAGAVRKNAGMG